MSVDNHYLHSFLMYIFSIVYNLRYSSFIYIVRVRVSCQLLYVCINPYNLMFAYDKLPFSVLACLCQPLYCRYKTRVSFSLLSVCFILSNVLLTYERLLCCAVSIIFITEYWCRAGLSFPLLSACINLYNIRVGHVSRFRYCLFLLIFRLCANDTPPFSFIFCLN